jgi:hypothetical protein
MREITANSSGGSQSSLTAHFGLGQETAVDNIWVRWPSGLVEDLGPPSRVDQYVTIIEGQGEVIETETPSGVLTR